MKGSKILANGALEHDREYAIFNEQGVLITGKREARVHLLRTSFDLPARTVTLKIQGARRGRTFDLEDGRGQLDLWLSGYFGFRVTLKKAPRCFPHHDDTPGPTVVSRASLEEASTWLDSVSAGQLRRRLRVNLEISGTAPFWEDCLVGKPKTTVAFRVGSVRINGVYPCERCVVPSRDPLTGEPYQKFQSILAAKRKENMPPWAELSSFPHFYHLCVLTKVPVTEAGKVIRVGDEVEVIATD